MTEVFVWFHNHSDKPADSRAFYQELLGWKPADGPGGMSLFSGEKGPFAAVGEKEDQLVGWLPYVEVEDVDDATQRARKLGATLLKEKRRGPAGEFTVIRDPGGASLALWQKA